MRLFIAIKFTEDIRLFLDKLAKELKAHSASGTFTLKENYHLTLAFIGETDRCRDLKRILNTISFDRFDIRFSGSGNFGDIQWVGLERSDPLDRLAGIIKQKLISEGFDIDRKPFRPHITLARKCVPDKGFRLSVPETDMTCTAVSLMDSSRINGRLTYTEIFKKELS